MPPSTKHPTWSPMWTAVRSNMAGEVTQFHFYHLSHPLYISAVTPCDEVNFRYNSPINFTQGGRR